VNVAAFASTSRTTVDGAGLAYRRAGEGAPVLLVHGIPTSSRLWDFVGGELAREFDVIAPDLLGYGESDKLLDRDVSVSAQADLMGALLNELGMERPMVVGHDIGGAVAQILAVRHPERVGALCLVDSVSFDSWPIAPMIALRRSAPLVSKLPPGWITATLAAALERELPDRAHEPLESSLGAWDHDAESLAAFFRNVEALDSRHTQAIADDLRRLDLPARIVWGASDQFQKPEWAPRLRDAIPGATLRLLDCGHFVPWQRPEELAEEIRTLAKRS
jgi:2-hydroxymuconate-semialdehyde hydrolase